MSFRIAKSTPKQLLKSDVCHTPPAQHHASEVGLICISDTPYFKKSVIRKTYLAAKKAKQVESKQGTQKNIIILPGSLYVFNQRQEMLMKKAIQQHAQNKKIADVKLTPEESIRLCNEGRDRDRRKANEAALAVVYVEGGFTENAGVTQSGCRIYRTARADEKKNHSRIKVNQLEKIVHDLQEKDSSLKMTLQLVPEKACAHQIGDFLPDKQPTGALTGLYTQYYKEVYARLESHIPTLTKQQLFAELPVKLNEHNKVVVLVEWFEVVNHPVYDEKLEAFHTALGLDKDKDALKRFFLKLRTLETQTETDALLAEKDNKFLVKLYQLICKHTKSRLKQILKDLRQPLEKFSPTVLEEFEKLIFSDEIDFIEQELIGLAALSDVQPSLLYPFSQSELGAEIFELLQNIVPTLTCRDTALYIKLESEIAAFLPNKNTQEIVYAYLMQTPRQDDLKTELPSLPAPLPSQASREAQLFSAFSRLLAGLGIASSQIEKWKMLYSCRIATKETELKIAPATSSDQFYKCSVQVHESISVYNLNELIKIFQELQAVFADKPELLSQLTIKLSSYEHSHYIPILSTYSPNIIIDRITEEFFECYTVLHRDGKLILFYNKQINEWCLLNYYIFKQSQNITDAISDSDLRESAHLHQELADAILAMQPIPWQELHAMRTIGLAIKIYANDAIKEQIKPYIAAWKNQTKDIHEKHPAAVPVCQATGCSIDDLVLKYSSLQTIAKKVLARQRFFTCCVKAAELPQLDHDALAELSTYAAPM